MISRQPGRSLPRLITHLLSPAGVAALVFLGIPLLTGEGLRAGLVAVGIFVILPVALVKRVRAAWGIEDIYDPGPQMRARILVLGNIVYLIGFITLKMIGAGPIMLWSAASFLCGGALVWMISRYWKISIHAVGVAGGTIILLIAGGTGLWPVVLAPIAVSWARLRLGAHTIGQLLAGSVLGAGVSVLLLPLFSS